MFTHAIMNKCIGDMKINCFLKKNINILLAVEILICDCTMIALITFNETILNRSIKC